MTRAVRKARRITELYYITHVENIPSILNKGILSHERIEKENIPYVPIYDKEIIFKRQEITVPDGRSLWSFANLYFNARNPMLYRVRSEKPVNMIAILGINLEILKHPGVFVTTGNAASPQSEIKTVSQKLISQIAKETNYWYWDPEDGSKRKMMAECLVPGEVPPELIKSIYVAGYETLGYDPIQKITNKFSSFIVEPEMFFEPFKQYTITPQLSVRQGDMFFSGMQTLTISVNTVGVMGKGVASRAKYQFPRVYVYYQDLCRSRQLTMGKPFLYKPEFSLDYQLADEPLTMSNANSETWFLLFPTKQDWRDRADIRGIEKGLQWLGENYKKERVRSLAIPALGCGLGRLDWKDVGPMLCRYLSTLDIPVSIYLPVEREIPEKQVTREFLLPEGSQL